MSSVRFKEDNKVELDLHFGCSVWLYDEEVQMPEMQQFMGFIIDLYDNDPSKWTKWRSFYISMNTLIELDFSEDAKKIKIPGEQWISDLAKTFTGQDKEFTLPKMSENIPLIFGRVLDFQPTIHELKVFDGKTEMLSEAKTLNKAIMDARTHEFWENPVLRPVFELFFGHTVPLAPFPTTEACLGLRPKDSQLSIQEGMAIMSYDYKVDGSTTKCLFEMQQTKLLREAKKIEAKEKSPMNMAGKTLEKLLSVAQGQVFENLPPLDLPKIMNDPTVQKIAQLAQDEKLQRQVKEGFDNVAKGIDKLFNPNPR